MNIWQNDKKKPHFVSEARISRQCEREIKCFSHVLCPLGNDKTNIVYDFSYTKWYS